MTNSHTPFSPLRVAPFVSFVVFAASVALMTWLRLYLFGSRFIALTYGMPLLFCLWYPDRRLLWSMAGAFVLLSAIKAFVLMPPTGAHDVSGLAHWTMQLINVVTVAAVVDVVIRLAGRLRAQNAELERTNQILTAREVEISRQNEELHAQNEELTEQNEEIQQQSEEIQQQAEELQTQSEELHATNSEIVRREQMMETLLDAIHLPPNEPNVPRHICEPLLALFAGAASAVGVLERKGDELEVLCHAGAPDLAEARWSFGGSFAAVVLTHNRTAFIGDLARRPDLKAGRPVAGEFRSVLGTPLRLNGKPVGVIQVMSEHPRDWSAEEFRILEWAAAQCSLLMDIRQLQAQLIRANASLDHTVRERTTELQEMVHELEHFSYTITHDMRAPLRAMQGYAELLAEECAESLSTDGRAYLQRIITAAGRMDRLITDALSYSKAVRNEMHVTPLDPGELIRGMIDSYPIFQPPRARIEVAPDLPPVMGNEAGLTQCISNLLGNAVKFVGKDQVPHVKVHAERFNGTVRLWVEDNGIGIHPAMQSRVFGMFQRLSKDYEGTGIGLALVQKVTHRMGGRVGVISEPGKGSRFWLELKHALSPATPLQPAHS